MHLLVDLITAFLIFLLLAIFGECALSLLLLGGNQPPLPLPPSLPYHFVRPRDSSPLPINTPSQRVV